MTGVCVNKMAGDWISTTFSSPHLTSTNMMRNGWPFKIYVLFGSESLKK